MLAFFIDNSTINISNLRCLLAVVFSFATSSLAYAQQTLSFLHQGRTRTALVYAPPPTFLRPGLVLVLHPGLSNAANVANSSGWHLVGDTAGFVTAYPNGTSRVGGATTFQWNAYAPSTGNNVDDIGYLTRLIDTLTNRYSIDTCKVYVSGFSNGAWMSWRLSCDFTSRFAAVGSLSGSWKYGRDGFCDRGGCTGAPIPGTNPPSAEAEINCVPARRMPYMYYRGTNEASLTDRAVTDPNNAAFWQRHNGCAPMPVRDTIQLGTDRIFREQYPACQDAAETIVMNVAGNSHLWHRSATQQFWAFFKRHPRCLSTTASQPTAPARSLQQRLLLIPQPAHRKVTLYGLTGGRASTVKLTSLTGHRAWHLQLESGKSQLELDEVPAGLYLLEVWQGVDRAIRKLVIE